MKRDLHEAGFMALANAIIVQAVEDYHNAGKSSQHIDELEDFFVSEWYETLTNIDADYLKRKGVVTL